MVTESEFLGHPVGMRAETETPRSQTALSPGKSGPFLFDANIGWAKNNSISACTNFISVAADDARIFDRRDRLKTAALSNSVELI